MTPLEDRILLEDNHLLVINKLPGEIVQSDQSGDQSLHEACKEYIKHKYNKPGNVYLGVVHRIDRPTSGIVLFGKTSKALSRLSKSFKTKTIKKRYWAVVGERPDPPVNLLENYLRKNPGKNKSFVVDESAKGAKEAVMSYKYLGASDRYHLLEVELKTGRHHQIRVQLSHINLPIKGDIKYGFKRTNPDGSIHLHARYIQFEHPVGNAPVELEAMPPKDPVWDYFVSVFS